MSADGKPGPVRIGAAAPDFSLPAVHRDGMVSISDFKGRSPVFLAIFRGLYCPFCRRAIAQLSVMNEQLRQAGVEVLAVVATETDNARLYFRHRPAKIQLAADPACTTHRAYGLPSRVIDAQVIQSLAEVRINPTGELRQPMPPLEAASALNEIHGYMLTATDHNDLGRQGAQLKGQFLLDRDAVVRWSKIECADDGFAGFGSVPDEEQLREALRTLH